MISHMDFKAMLCEPIFKKLKTTISACDQTLSLVRKSLSGIRITRD